MPSRRRSPGSRISIRPFDDEPDTVSSNGIVNASPRPLPRRVNTRRRRTNPLRATVYTLIFVVLACIGGYAGYLYRNSIALRKYVPSFLQGASVNSAFPGVKSMNLMIIGRDYDYNNRDQIVTSNARSDMLMVAHIDFAGKTAQLLSIPRDTAAVIPGHLVTKINAAQAFGGPALAAATIKENFGIPVDHYVSMDFDGFKEAIDLLGGIDCDVDKKMDYDDNWGHLHIHLLPGYQHLNGEQAMEFVRFRHSDSDLVRIRRQQALLAQLKAKLVEPETLAILPALLDTIDKHVSSDLSSNQKVALAKFLHEIPSQNVSMATLPSIDSRDLVETDFDKASPVVKSIFGVNMPQRLAIDNDSGHRRHSRFRRRRSNLT